MRVISLSALVVPLGFIAQVVQQHQHSASSRKSARVSYAGFVGSLRQSMNWLPLDSRALNAVACFPAERLLYLAFHSGERYRYFEVPPELYQDFLAAESKGTYFGKDIRNHFLYEQLPHTRRAGG